MWYLKFVQEAGAPAPTIVSGKLRQAGYAGGTWSHYQCIRTDELCSADMLVTADMTRSATHYGAGMIASSDSTLSNFYYSAGVPTDRNASLNRVVAGVGAGLKSGSLGGQPASLRVTTDGANRVLVSDAGIGTYTDSTNPLTYKHAGLNMGTVFNGSYRDADNFYAREP